MRVIATFRAQLFDRGSILRALAHTIDEVVRAARAMWEKAVICAAIMHNGASRIVQRQSPRRCAALCARRRPEWRFAHRVARSKAPRETVPIGHETREATPSDGRSGGKNERGRIGRGWSLEWRAMTWSREPFERSKGRSEGSNAQFCATRVG